MKILIFCAVTSSFLPAQEPGKPEKQGKNKSSVSLIAIGDPHTVTLTTTIKGSYYDPPKPSECPPSALYVEDKKNNKGFDQLGLSVNRPCRPIKQPLGAKLRLFENKGDAGSEDKTPYLTITLPETKQDLTVFLLRSKSSKGWLSKPRYVTLKNDRLTFPLNSVRVVNLSTHTANYKIGNTAFMLAPNASRVLRYPSSQGVLRYAIAIHQDKGKPKLLANQGLSYFDQTRVNIITYDADGDKKDKKKPVHFTRYFEINR